MLSDPRSADIPADLGEVLQKLGRLSLSRFPSTLVQDRKRMLKLDGLSAEFEAALMVRVAEMECLQCLVNALDAGTEGLIALAAKTWVRPWKESKKRAVAGSK